jgi:hypothetical protein
MEVRLNHFRPSPPSGRPANILILLAWRYFFALAPILRTSYLGTSAGTPMLGRQSMVHLN